MLSSVERSDRSEFGWREREGKARGGTIKNFDSWTEMSAGDSHRKSGIPAAVLIPAPVWTTT